MSGKITLTSDLLDFGPEPTNVLLFLPIDGQTVGEIFSHEVEMYIESGLDDAGLDYKDLNGGPLEIDADYQKMTQEYVKMIADGEAPEAFAELLTPDGDTPPILKIVDVCDDLHGDGWGRSIMTATVSVDGERLLALAHEYGITEVHDGRGISGFIRTANDHFWCVVQTVNAVLEAMADVSSPWMIFHNHAWELNLVGTLDLMEYAAESDLDALDTAIQSALDARTA